jgi:acyl-CoA synthetase (AMP-forming)/AMP-acid ligase II
MSAPAPARLGRARVVARVLGGLARAARPGRPTTLAGQIAAHARRLPEAPALRCGGATWTWRAFDSEAAHLAAALAAHGARAGDTVALALGNTPATLVAVTACARLGVAAALLPAGASGAALRHALDAATPRWVLVGEESRAALVALGPAVAACLLDDRQLRDTAAPPPPPAPVPDDATMLYLYTSGTTGLPKAARITVRRFRRFATGFACAICRLRRDDVVYLALPLTHATGLLAAWGASVVAGATLALRPHFSTSAFWSDCRDVGATVVPYIGEICRYLVAAPPHPDERRHRVRLFYGAGLRRDVWEALQHRFAIPEIVEFYGSTEGTVGLVNLEGVPGMLGRLLPRQAVVRVDDAGEPLRDARGRLCRVGTGHTGLLLGRIDDAHRFDGYTDDAATRAKILRDPFGDGHDWFSTGDLVRRHPGRWLSFVDRLGDTFRWKGENVSTTEVAEELLRCPGVAEAIVYGVEVPGCEGRAGMAAIVPGPAFSPNRLAAHVAATLARPARPLFLRLVAAPDLTGNFKYVKTRLQREGYDSTASADPLFRFVESGPAYEPLSPLTTTAAPAAGGTTRANTGPAVTAADSARSWSPSRP